MEMHDIHTKDSSFAIIAVRCDDALCAGHKNLKVGQTYYLLQGYTIYEDKITVEQTRVELNRLYDDYSVDSKNKIPHINFSAIVGRNGSGKSSIIELMMRIINNYATSLFGEINHDPAAESLHYIENVFATLWFACDCKIYKLAIDNHELFLTEFIEHESDGAYISFRKNSPKLISNSLPLTVEWSVGSPVHIYDGSPNIANLLSAFFYTFVSNYSIYAYNTKDYCLENKEGDRGDDSICWIHSLFHKNDGYKVPLGLAPFRVEGNININNEKELANERLISLMIRNRDYRTLNRHLVADGLNIKTSEVADYGLNAVVSTLKFKNLAQDGYNFLRKNILLYWENELGLKFTNKSAKAFSSNALDYIVYKTLKISKQYKEHNDFYKLNDLATNFNENIIEDLVKGESEDHSHITRKIYQTIAYLFFDVYNLTYDENEIFIDFDTIHRNSPDGVEQVGRITRNWKHLIKSALMPPPFLVNQIALHSYDTSEGVLFESLSSGEKQQIYTISSILYHLDNLNSINEDAYDKERIFYSNINIILEEIELYYHPQMQQEFVKFLIDGIHAMNLEKLKSVNFIIVTHSPYVLSDIPSANILALERDGICVNSNELKAFGANLHDMLRSSFFLKDGTIGLFAKWIVKHIMACLEIHKWATRVDVDFHDYQKIYNDEEKNAFEFMERYIDTSCNEKTFDYDRFNKELGKAQLLQKIKLLDEPVVHHILMDQYYLVFGKKEKSKQEKREELLKQLKELEEEDDTI